MSPLITALGCLALGFYRFYELSKNINKLSKSGMYCEIAISSLLIAIGTILIIRMV